MPGEGSPAASMVLFQQAAVLWSLLKGKAAQRESQETVKTRGPEGGGGGTSHVSLTVFYLGASCVFNFSLAFATDSSMKLLWDVDGFWKLLHTH